MLARLQESLDRVEGRQVNTLASLEESYESKARRMRAVLADVGLDAAKHANAATGGPFVSYRLSPNAGPFEKQVYRINVARAQAERLASTVGAMPLRKPVEGEIDTSSSFGVRIDPFLARPAMHTGLDFRGDTGEAIRVTAGGTVVSAGWSGGYGRMVEVDHGNGLSTRYGHLSEIDVKVGPDREGGPDRRPHGLDRTLHRAASALRDPHRRRSGRPAEVPPRRREVRADVTQDRGPKRTGPLPSSVAPTIDRSRDHGTERNELRSADFADQSGTPLVRVLCSVLLCTLCYCQAE